VIVQLSDLLEQAIPDGSTTLLWRREELMAPFGSLDRVAFDRTLLRSEVAPPATGLMRVAELVVNYSYAIHFQGTPSDIPYHTPATAPATRVIVAVQPFGGTDLVVGTVRVIWIDQLEVFDLFDISAPARWPHEALGRQFGEFGRVAMHPVVDAVARHSDPELRDHGRRYRAAIWDVLRAGFERVLVEQGRLFAYHIASERSRRFFASAGYVATRLDVARPSRSEAARRTRREWPQYFRPDDPVELQPRVYYRSTLPEP
jgi:hypothetical protein